MKIGIVCPYNLLVPGGVQDHVQHQARELRRRGHSVKIITPRPRGYKDGEPSDVIFIGQSTRIKTPGHTSADVSMSVDTDVIDAVLQRERFDLIHIHEPLVPILGAQLLSRANCPSIGTFHAAMPDTLVVKSIVGSIGPYKRGIFKDLNAITAVSWAATSTLDHEIPSEKLHIIPNGIDLAKYRLEENVHREPQTILYIGRLEKRKGVRYLIDAFALVNEHYPKAKLVIAGDGPERKMLENRVKNQKVQNVRFLGYISEAEKLTHLAQCAVFTSPALYGESFGIVLLEAMATGAVTVAGDNPGYASVLTETGRISLVDPRNASDYAARLELLMTDRGLQDYWRAWAKRHVQQYQYQDIVDQYEALYAELVRP